MDIDRGGASVAFVALAVGGVCWYSIPSPVEDLSELDMAGLQKRLKAIAQEGDVLKAIHQLAEAIPFEKLQAFVTNKHPTHKNALESAQRMVRQARSYLALRERASPSMRATLNTIFDTLIAILDSVFNAFGVADFFELAESKIEGEFKFQKIMMLISLFTLLTATLLPILGVTTGASIVGGTLLAIALSASYGPISALSPPVLPRVKTGASK